MTTTGEMIARIRAAYGLPVTDTLTDEDMEVADVLVETWKHGKQVGERKAAKEANAT